jgi:hypothetical protein
MQYKAHVFVLLYQYEIALLPQPEHVPVTATSRLHTGLLYSLFPYVSCNKNQINFMSASDVKYNFTTSFGEEIAVKVL